MAKTVYDIIKRQNGERFARVLRDKSLLDIPDIENIVKYAGHDNTAAEQIAPYLWSLKEFKEEKAAVTEDPFKLLDAAGYHAFEVHNLDEQNSIKHFFRKNEELCTFHDSVRFLNYYIIHAVKHDVWRAPYAIKPLPHPERQDAYGTSVISIQIDKSGGFISIKNRYNHTVRNPDQTFHSNPDEIIPGLSASLKAYFNVDWQQTRVNIPDGFILLNRQILKTDFEVNNRYFGDGFYTDNGNIVNIDKRKQVQIENFIWDAHAKQLLNPSGANDDFVRVFNKITRGKKVDITGQSPNQTILVNGVPIIELKNNQIVTLNLPGIKHIRDNFLIHNKSLTTLNAPNLKNVGNEFLYNNKAPTTLNAPNLNSVGDYFMYSNRMLTTLDLPNLQHVGDDFLPCNKILTTVNVPNLKSIGYAFMYYNEELTSLNVPNLKSVGEKFMFFNNKLTTLNAQNLESVGNNVLYHNETLTTLNTPKLRERGRYFLYRHPARDKFILQIIEAKAEHKNIAARFKRGMQNIFTKLQITGNAHANPGM